MSAVPESIGVRELARLAASAEPPVVLDVREGWERDIVALPGSLHIPLALIPRRVDEVPHDRHVVVLCHHGARSAQATAWLRGNGVEASNLEGGIDAWALEIDPSVPRY